MIAVRTPSGDVDIGAVSIRTASGNVDIARISVLTPDGDKIVYDSASPGGLAVAMVAPSVIGSALSALNATVETSTATATVTGGTAPYAYAWALDSGNAGWSIVDDDAATTAFRFDSLAAGDSEFATFEITVTDARGRTGTATVQASVYNYGPWSNA